MVNSEWYKATTANKILEEYKRIAFFALDENNVVSEHDKLPCHEQNQALASIYGTATVNCCKLTGPVLSSHGGKPCEAPLRQPLVTPRQALPLASRLR